jgi:hypothetical protein
MFPQGIDIILSHIGDEGAKLLPIRGALFFEHVERRLPVCDLAHCLIPSG